MKLIVYTLDRNLCLEEFADSAEESFEQRVGQLLDGGFSDVVVYNVSTKVKPRLEVVKKLHFDLISGNPL